MQWRDVHSDAPGGAWLGLELDAPPSLPKCPYLHVEVAPPYLMKLVAGDSPLVWARIAPDHYGYWYLRSGRWDQHSPLALVPPLTAATARRVRCDFGSASWYAAWARLLFRELHSGPRTPLHPGRWWMTRCPAEVRDDPGWRHVGAPWPAIPPASFLERIHAQPPHDYSPWDFNDELVPLALRPLSADTDGRVKAWRKAFRESCLPPVLLLWISGLCRYVIIDGHDRLLAALLEGRAPPVLALLPVTESKPRVDPARTAAITRGVQDLLSAARSIPPRRGREFTVESANRLLIDAYENRPRLSLTTRAWPMRDGVRSWFTEVRGELEKSTADQVHSEMQAELS